MRLAGGEFRGGRRKAPPEMPEQEKVREVTAEERANAPFLLCLSGHDAGRVETAKRWAAGDGYGWAS